MNKIWLLSAGNSCGTHSTGFRLDTFFFSFHFASPATQPLVSLLLWSFNTCLPVLKSANSGCSLSICCVLGTVLRTLHSTKIAPIVKVTIWVPVVNTTGVT